MLDENTVIAWSCYLLGVAGLLFIVWRLTRPIGWPRVRRQLLLVLTVLLVYPFDVGEGYSQWAPATLMLLMETVFEGGEAFNRVGPTLMAVTIAAVMLLALAELGVYLWRKKGRQPPLGEQNAAPVGDDNMTQTPRENGCR